tara:strand:- start:3089 stop:3661 length:573 start_codon:yes stop_codon:yes gene_type:complete
MTSPQENILSRRTIYKFMDKDVSQAIITQALKAASCAPSHKHTHPWRFYSIGKNTRESLIPLITKLARIKSEKKGSNNVIKDIERAVSKIQNAPVLFAITSKLSPNDSFREKEDYAATVCALHNMVLSFWANGVGSLWSTGSLTRDSETYQKLGINEQEEEIIGFIRSGYPLSTPDVSKPSHEDVTTYLD